MLTPSRMQVERGKSLKFPWAEHPELVAFYKQHRKCPDDLYPSERRFLPWLAQQADSVLDVGCAAGGFRYIWRHYHSNIPYTGVDISAALVAVARKLYPDTEFHQGDCATGLPLGDRYATVVQALGWMHWEHQYWAAIQELWRLTDRYLFFDLRLVAEPRQVVNGRQQVAFVGPWDGETTTPYLVVDWSTIAVFLLGLRPVTLLGYGYWGNPAETVMGVDQQICFATFVLEKAPIEDNPRLPRVCIELPLEWPAALAKPVNLLPAGQLDTLVPRAQDRNIRQMASTDPLR